MDYEARRPPVAGDHDLERVRPPSPLAPQDHSHRARECRAVAAGEQRCVGGVARVALKVAYGVDAAVDADEMSSRYPIRDGPRRESAGVELLSCDVAALPLGEAMHVIC